MENVYVVHQIKRTNGVWNKGIVVKADENLNNREEALQGYHSYLGAYAYNHEAGTDFVSCEVTNALGEVIIIEIWEKQPEPEVEPEPEPEQPEE